MAFETRVAAARRLSAHPGPVSATLIIAAAALAACVSPPLAPAPLRPVADWPIARPIMRRSSCADPAWAAQPARANASAIGILPWAGFGRIERGWAVYSPAIAVEIGSPCQADTPGFAADLLRWQTAQRLAATGAVDIATLDRLRQIWQARRPFVAVRARAVCPDPPAPTELDTAGPTEGLGAKPVQLRRDAFAAYRAMVAAARAEVAEIARNPTLLTLMSGYRSPDYDAARCAHDGNCQGVVRAACSAHRTGLAIDLHLGAAPGFTADSSADANRLAQVRGPAYRWLIANARRFGFIPYAFEPWHWEWTGGAP